MRVANEGKIKMTPTKPLHCLSVQQPWAWAICAGIKTVENRNWSTDYRGPVAIHASSSAASLRALEPQWPGISRDPRFVRGAIIGLAELVDVRPLDGELADNPWAEGPVCLVFDRARLFTRPLDNKGKLMLHRVADALVSAILAADRDRAPGPDLQQRRHVEQRLLGDEVAICRRRGCACTEAGDWPGAEAVGRRLVELEPQGVFGYQLISQA